MNFLRHINHTSSLLSSPSVSHERDNQRGRQSFRRKAPEWITSPPLLMTLSVTSHPRVADFIQSFTQLYCNIGTSCSQL